MRQVDIVSKRYDASVSAWYVDRQDIRVPCVHGKKSPGARCSSTSAIHVYHGTQSNSFTLVNVLLPLSYSNRARC